MKLMRIAAGEHHLEGAPAGVRFDGRTRELDVGDLLPAGRFPVTLVGREGGVEVSVSMTIAATGEPPAPAPKRRRRTAAPKAAAKKT